NVGELRKTDRALRPEFKKNTTPILFSGVEPQAAANGRGAPGGGNSGTPGLTFHSEDPCPAGRGFSAEEAIMATTTATVSQEQREAERRRSEQKMARRAETARRIKDI